MSERVTAEAVATFLGATLLGPDLSLHGVSELDEPEPHSLTFATPAYRDRVERLAASGPLAVLVTEAPETPGVTQIRVPDARLAFARALAEFFPRPRGLPGVAATAVVAHTAQLGRDVSIGNFSVIGDGAVVGDGTEIRHHVVIGERCRLGRDCLIKSHAVIGEEGFGFQLDEQGRAIRLAHHGWVEIGDEVEVGAATVIAQGTIRATSIGDRVKIDDHCFIAHNVTVGADSLIIAGAEISGGVTLGAGTWVAPQVSVRNKISVGDRAMLGMGAVVVRDVPANAVVAGNPARVLRERYPSDG